MTTLRTARLLLRPITLDDAPAVQRGVSPYEIALNTLNIRHPYPENGAVEWIGTLRNETESVHFAIDDGELCGSIGLMFRGDAIYEIGYWIAVDRWGRGYATEAVGAAIRHAFEELQAHRVYAGYFARNPASGRVLEKCGLRYEGTLRQHVKKWDEYLDVVYHGIVRDDWFSSPRS